LSFGLRSVTSLSIFWRTFAFMFAALLVAEGIGVTLQLNQPPVRRTAIRFSMVAQQLAEPGDGFQRESAPGSDPSMGPRANFDEAPANAPPGGFPQQPPTGVGMQALPPGVGMPLPPMLPPGLELAARVSATPPSEPSNSDAAASEALRGRLAGTLGVAVEQVRFYVGRGAVDAAAAATLWEISLREGLVAARHLPSGEWRIVESEAEAFPTTFQRQVILLFILGVLVLLPLAWAFSATLSAPVRGFSAAAKRVGSDPGAPPLPRVGPAEMRDAVDSFNAMQARLNRLLQERTQMVGAIAHDLRTPLTRLAFRLEDLPPALRSKVYADIEEMKMMISAALDFIHDRSRSTRRERLDFRVLVESVVDDHSDLGHDVTLQAGGPITLEGDPLALKRVVVNLVDNAVKYGERARLRLAVTGSRCVLEVDDDGPGIPPELQQRVFDPFFRVESSRNRDTGGIGLGLATVQSIVTDHDGEVELRNRKGGGLRAMVSLPVPAA
jgi:two-component system OmpR family sensor kinase